MMSAVKVHSLGHYTVVFVSYNSVQVGREYLQDKLFCHKEGIGHSNYVGILQDTY